MVPLSHKPLVIAFVSNSCWSVYNFRSEVIRNFLQHGYEVYVIAGKDDFAVRLIDMGFKVHTISFNNRDMSLVANIKLFWQLRAVYKKIRPSLIFHYGIKPNIFGTLAAGSLGLPSIAVITGLGYTFSRKGILRSIVSALYRFSLKRASEIWFLNEEDAAFFKAYKLAPANRIFVLQSEGVNLEKFVPASPTAMKNRKPFVFLMLTRMLWSKGVGVFAEAAALLKKKGYHFECRVMGFFEPLHPDTISLQDFQRWKSNHTFSYDGFAEDVLPHLQNADCFVLPTFYKEGVPRSLLEACAVELPVITTNHTGCRDVIQHGINGLLCRVNDAGDLADKMEQMILFSPEDRAAIGFAARITTAKKFSIQFVIQQYDNAVAKFTGVKPSITFPEAIV